jgi:hypothetical protein
VHTASPRSDEGDDHHDAAPDVPLVREPFRDFNDAAGVRDGCRDLLAHTEPNACRDVYGRVADSEDLVRLGTRSDVDMQTVGTLNFSIQMPSDE